MLHVGRVSFMSLLGFDCPNCPPPSSSQGHLILITVGVLKFTHHTLQWSPDSFVEVFIFSGSSHTCWFLLLLPIQMQIIYRSCTVSLLFLFLLDTLSPCFVKNVVHRFLVFLSSFSIFIQGFKKTRDCVAIATVVFSELSFIFYLKNKNILLFFILKKCYLTTTIM